MFKSHQLQVLDIRKPTTNSCQTGVLVLRTEMPATIIPKALEPGATIAFVSPSFRANDEYSTVISRAASMLERRGYKVRILFNKDTGVQSSIANRLAELRTAFSDPSISAISCTIGGSSLNELLPALTADTELHGIIRANPKIVVGYSDITCLHWFLHAFTGLRTFYGPGALPELGEPTSVDDDTTALAFCVKHLFSAISNRDPIGDFPRSLTYAPKISTVFSEPASTQPPELVPNAGWIWIRPGKARGRLFGGCLTVMARMNGVRSIVPDWRGRIVFFETAIGEDEVSGNPLYRVRAGIADLIAQGVFEEAAGLVIGRPFGYDSPEMREEYIGVVRELLCEGPLAKNFPILFNIDIGHTTPIATLPFDALATLDSEEDKFAILESAVM
ncbi:peptidase [Hypoxylon sp. FL0543]|nr:peptidase [Hypoxylon sp. FL0543]